MDLCWLFRDQDHYRGRSPTRERDRDRKRDSHRYRYSCYDLWVHCCFQKALFLICYGLDFIDMFAVIVMYKIYMLATALSDVF